jgi:alkanesulfonate monooxygenase SsuD/methylene tetrahydromethanopterin reductase-like flavin-dependent oxidoreductase (luciferase family)
MPAARMKFGLFFLCEQPPWQGSRAALKDAIDQAAYADALGFDAVWIAEHHFSGYGVAPDVAVLAAALLPRVTRMRIGTAVTILPFNNPVRTAESFAMVDVLSDGRLDFGVGRGYQPAEFAGFGVPMEESRARFDEALTLVRRAWTEDRVTFEGRFFTVRDVRVLPKPVQKPHPPIWAAAVSPESFPEMARQGLHILTAPSITPPALMKQSYDAYRRVWQESGHPPERIEVPALHFVYVGASEPRARREPEPNLMWYFDTVRGLIAPDHPDEVAAGYGFYAKARRHLERVDYDHLYGDVVLFGDAERVTERIRFLRDDLGVTYLMCWMNFGGLASDLARDSIRRFAEHVMPKFR